MVWSAIVDTAHGMGMSADVCLDAATILPPPRFDAGASIFVFEEESALPPAMSVRIDSAFGVRRVRAAR